MKKTFLLVLLTLLCSCGNNATIEQKQNNNETTFPSYLNHLKFPSSFTYKDKTYCDSGVYKIVYDITLEAYFYHPDNIKKEEYEEYSSYTLIACKDLSYNFDSYICPIYSVKNDDSLYVGLKYFRLFTLNK